MITRRTLMRNSSLGTAGLALAPFVQHMRAHAAGDTAKLPKRFVFVTTANGIDPGYLFPAEREGETEKGGYHVKSFSNALSPVDSVIDVSLRKVGIPHWLKSLEPLADYTTCISGLSGKMCRGWHSAGFGALGAHASGDKGKPGGETIDGALAKAMPSIFPHVAVNASNRIQLSAIAKGVPLPTYTDPIEVYDILFGVISEGIAARRRSRFGGKLLDFMVEDIKLYERSLPSTEREKLGYYLSAFENMGARHKQLLAKKAELKKLNPSIPAGPYNGENAVAWEDKAESMCELVVQAMIAGLTNVASINLDGGSSNGARYGKRSGFEVPTGGHGFGHSSASKRVKPFGFCAERVAKMAATLKAVPEGDGSMLDNTLFLMVSTSGSTHHTKHINWPMLLVGGCGTRLRKGRHIQYPSHGKKGNATIGSMYTTLLHAAGFPRNGFGQFDVSTPNDVQKQPLNELMA